MNTHMVHLRRLGDKLSSQISPFTCGSWVLNLDGQTAVSACLMYICASACTHKHILKIF